MASRVQEFTAEEQNVIQEALANYSNEDISDDDFYDPVIRERLKEVRDSLLTEFNS